MNLISGALRPDGGRIALDGTDISGMAAHAVFHAGIGRTFQLVRVVQHLTVRENVLAGIAFVAHRLGFREMERRVQECLTRVELESSLDRPASELTYIDQKRLELARAIVAQPKLLLLDEWLAGLSTAELHTGIQLIRSLNQKGSTIIMIEHVMSAISNLCDRCVVMNAGVKIAEGAPQQVLVDTAVRSAYLGTENA